MKLLKLSEDPFLNAINKSIKLKWDLRRHCVSSYVDLDKYYILDKETQNEIYSNLSFDEMVNLIDKSYKQFEGMLDKTQ